MSKKFYPGSYTVEASLIMGIVLAVIFSLLYLSFSSYDRLRLAFVLRETVLWGAAGMERGEEVTSELLISKVKSRQIFLFNLQDITFQSEIKDNKIFMSYKAEEVYLGRTGTLRSFQIEEKIHRPETTLRIAHLFYKGGGS